MKHRRPEMPASMEAFAVRGTCRWCALPITKPDGTPKLVTWHPECVTIYRVACFSDDQRRAVFKRDDGICARCGRDTLEGHRLKPPHHAYHRYRMGHLWQADHIKPLIEANGDISFFLLENLQTLCHECHITKGKEDNRRRRELDAASQPELLVLDSQKLSM